MRSPEHPGLLGHRAVSQSELGSWGPLPDRRICPQHADNNQASGASKAEGHSNAPDTRNGAHGQPPTLPCYTPGIPCLSQMAAPGLFHHMC